jgi:dephospho-CoA kinase
LRQLGLTVVDADQLAREVTAPGTTGAAEVIAAFGPAVAAAAAGIDRAKLAQIVFADPAEKARLEAIVHPLVRARRADLIAQAAARGEPVVVEDIPLLIETGQTGRFDELLVVEAPLSVRLRRLAQRGLSPTEAHQRIAAQASAAERAAIADVLLDGSGSVEALSDQVTSWWHCLLRQLGRAV